MMRSYLSLAWKELKAQKVTSVLILLAVILSTIATTAVGQSVGILQSMRIEQASSLNGDRYATFHQLTREQSGKLHADSRLKDVGSYITIGSTELGNSGLSLFLRQNDFRMIGKITEGRLPVSEREIALSGDAIQYLGIEGNPGDEITLPIGVSLLIDDRPKYEYTADFILTGILENNYLGYATGSVNGIVGDGTAQALLPERYLRYSTDFKTVHVKGFQEVIDDLVEELNLEERQVQYNWVVLDALGVDYAEKGSVDANAGFPFMMAACVLVGVLILLAAGLVIYNILKVAVAKRIREYGTLRAIGSEGGQLYKLVTLQLVILCAIGLPPGLLLGALSAKSILIAALGFLSPELFMADTTQQLNEAVSASGTGGALPLCVSALITVLFAMLAAYPSARYAAHVSPTVAMNGQAVKIRRRSRKQKRIRNFEAFYARLNLKRNRRRTVITILSIVMSITVFVALQSFSALLDTSQDVKDMHTGDYCVTNETVRMTPEAVAELAANEAVMKLATSKLTVYYSDENGDMPVDLDLTLLPGETFQIASVDEGRFDGFASGKQLTQEDADDLKSGAACLVMNPIPISYEGMEVEWTQLEEGDRITVNGKELRVAAITGKPVSISNEGFSNGVQIIVSDELYNILVGNDKYCEVYPTLSEDADHDAFESWLNTWSGENPGTHWLSYRQSDEQLAESFEQIRFLCWGLILFIGLIGILNIINTVYTNIHTRVDEIGMQRAIGMSVGSLYRTFLWEGAYYGIIASMIGAVSGYMCTLLVEAAANDGLSLSAVPVASILEAAVVSVAACLIATAIPLRAIGKMSVVESIETI